MFGLSAIPILMLFITVLSGLCNPSKPMSLKLTEKDSGRTLEICPGDTLRIELKGNPTTGYMWEVASADTAILKQVGETEFKPDRKARGSGGKIIMRFKAAMAGETSLKLVYYRPFEKNRPPIKIFEVTVSVK